MGASVKKVRIDEILKGYNPKNNSDITIATIGSHTAQQIVQGARDKGFRTLLISRHDPVERMAYDGFSECRPDEYLIVKDYKEILNKRFQQKLTDRCTIIIPHGSFVAYVGAENLAEKFEVPMLGNRKTMIWEEDRKKQRRWLEAAGLNLPRQYNSIDDIPFGEKDTPKLFFVKYSGAPGGKGFFNFKTKDEFLSTILLAEHKAQQNDEDKKNEDKKDITIQEFVPGNRHYLHFYATPFFNKGLPLKKNCSLELLSEDRRDEFADELHRIGFDHSKLKELDIVPDYEVSGNIPLVLREKYIGPAMEMGKKTVLAAQRLLGGITGPFCLETFLRKGKFYVFEISARIVAGTNPYTAKCPHPYTVKTWGKGMSHGDRMALEIEEGIKRNELHKIIY
jgi:5-formaminoimidazole-4-carboxamide-1-(beta)-D-ribofuranosyl 5'-monophosphate synthetase